MRNLLRADLCRMFRRGAFRGCALCMILVAVGLIFMQRTAMDSAVPFSRVIFLPLSFYGVAVAAMTALFVSEDFSSGVARNKLIAGHRRSRVYLSNLAAVSAACLAVFALTTAFTAAVAAALFEIDASAADVAACFALSLPMCLAYGSIYCAVCVRIRDRAKGVAACMALSFCMLFLSMQLHAALSARDLPASAGAIRRACEFAYDLVPTGVAAQLSSMRCDRPARCALLGAVWTVTATAAGILSFRKSDLR